MILYMKILNYCASKLYSSKLLFSKCNQLLSTLARTHAETLCVSFSCTHTRAQSRDDSDTHGRWLKHTQVHHCSKCQPVWQSGCVYHRKGKTHNVPGEGGKHRLMDMVGIRRRCPSMILCVCVRWRGSWSNSIHQGTISFRGHLFSLN